MSRWTACLAMLLGATVAKGGAVVELIPDQLGPYTGGEVVNVNVWLASGFADHYLLDKIRLDFSLSGVELNFDSQFQFDFSQITAGINSYALFTFPELPRPSTAQSFDCICPQYFLPLFAHENLHIGDVGVILPIRPGTYRMDVLNSEESAEPFGARIDAINYPAWTHDIWRADTGELGGGSYDFHVIPEPPMLMGILLGIGVLRFGYRPRWTVIALFVGAFCIPVQRSFGQLTLTPSRAVNMNLDSGLVGAGGTAGGEPEVVFSQVVTPPPPDDDTGWVRLHFSIVVLSGSEADGNGSYLRITSLADSASQRLGETALVFWNYTTAYFNGESVLMELLAYPGTGDNQVVVDEIRVSLFSCSGGAASPPDEPPVGDNCHLDQRIPILDRPVGRFLTDSPFGDDIFTAVCTAFLFNSTTNGLLSAGHCCESINPELFRPVIQFNAPPTLPCLAMQHPAPQHQYPLDLESVQFEVAIVERPEGRDWCYFGVFDNTDTGLAPLTAQGASVRLAVTVPPSDNSLLDVAGYGVHTSQPPRHVTLQRDEGAYQTGPFEWTVPPPSQGGPFETALGYSVFTADGMSGGPVENVCERVVLGIHTHGGCGAPMIDLNLGTAID